MIRNLLESPLHIVIWVQWVVTDWPDQKGKNNEQKAISRRAAKEEQEAAITDAVLDDRRCIGSCWGSFDSGHQLKPS